MDETGFNIGDFEARHVIVDTTVNSRYQAQPGRQEWVTSIECIGADGSWIPPAIIYTGENFVRKWHPVGFDPTWKVSNSSKGWTSRDHALMWLKQCFEPMTRDKAEGRHRLLICDGHDSHSTADFLAHCIEHKILLFLLIPHSSHIVQPLDAGIFRGVKLRLSGHVAPSINLGTDKIEKSEWLDFYYAAHGDVFTPENIKSCFSSTGIHPFNPTKAFNRIPMIQTPRNPPSTPRTNCNSTTATTPTESTPFPNQILNSSPSDFTVLRAANSALNQMIERADPLPTPARKFVRILTTAAEKLFTRASILQERTEAQERLLSTRQQRNSAKRSIIKGKFLLSTTEIHSEVSQAEANTMKNRNKRRKSA
jgi:DDE superfamily endonuclease